MPSSWKRALDHYWYPVDLTDYQRAKEFPGFFRMRIRGDRESTVAFENHYQNIAPASAAAFCEVVFWKLYSQKLVWQTSTNKVVDFVQREA